MEFISPNDEEIAGEVIGLIRYWAFRDLMADFDASILTDSSVSKQDLLDDLEVFCAPEEKLLSELKTST